MPPGSSRKVGYGSPVGYVNGSVALWMSAVWPALYIARSRPSPLLVRAVALAAAGLFVDLALLGQSRAWLFLMPVAAVVALLLARQRLRLVLAGALVTIAALAILRPLLDVHDQFDRELSPISRSGAEPWLVWRPVAASRGRRALVGGRRRGRGASSAQLALTASSSPRASPALRASCGVRRRPIDHPR